MMLNINLALEMNNPAPNSGVSGYHSGPAPMNLRYFWAKNYINIFLDPGSDSGWQNAVMKSETCSFDRGFKPKASQ